MTKKNFVTLILGTVGGILFALGMCMAMLPEWNAFTPGIVVGAVDLAQEGQCKMTYLPRESGAAIGDMILTSGGNIFPKGLKIGTIKEIRQEDHGVSLYAVVEPFASVNDAKDVFVITSFEGQGILIGEDLGQTGEKQSESSADSNAAEEDSSSVEAGQ